MDVCRRGRHGGDIYYVTLTREMVRVDSYFDDSIPVLLRGWIKLLFGEEFG